MIVNGDYILKWVEKSEHEEDDFDKFVYGFFALNALYSEYYDGDERGAIRTLFYQCFDSHEQDFKKIMDLPEYDYFARRAPILNMKYDPARGIGRSDTREDTRCLSERNARKSNRAMLMILYQIRCNLFHGNKAYGNPNDDEVMKNAAEILLHYNRIFCKDLERRRF